MDFDKERLQAAQMLLIDRGNSRMAPTVMWGGLLLLQGDEDVRASLTECQLEETTTWRTIWATDTRLIYAEATKALELWTAYSEDSAAAEADTLLTWARPYSEVVGLELTNQVMHKARHYSEDRMWDTVATFVFRDGLRIPIPLFGERPSYDGSGAVEKFIQTTSDRLWR